MSRWDSSYEQNNYGELFYALSRLYQPQKVVELGTKAGYSAYHIARGLAANGRGTLDCYDLWEKYEFNSVPQALAEQNLQDFKAIITYSQGDVIGVEKKYHEVDVLHVDLGNHAEILEKIIPAWINKVKKLIIIEGGSAERDLIDWMEKFQKGSIRKWLADFHKTNPETEYFTFEQFPSLTLIRKV